MESLNTKTTEEDLKDYSRKLELLYFFTLTDIVEKEYRGSETLLNSFPCLKKKRSLLKSILYGAMETTSEKKLLEWLEDFFPREEKKDSLIKTIDEACRRVAKLRITIEKKAKENSIETPNWEDILLSLPLIINEFDKVVDLFDTRDIILQNIKELVERNSISLPYSKTTKLLTKKPSLLEEILAIQKKMQDYHKTEKEEELNNILLIPHREINKEFGQLILHREKIAEAILDEEEKENRKMRLGIHKESHKDLKELEWQLYVNTGEIQNEILKTQCIEKIFFIIYKLSQYYKKMKHVEFINSIEGLKPGQKLGLSFIIYVSEIANKIILEIEGNDYELKNERYFFNEVIGKMKNSDPESSKSKAIEDILNCVEEMKSKSWQEKSRENYLLMFENSKKEEEIIKSNNEEQKNPE